MLCQRCGRTICPECQTPAAVGVHCPECVKEQRAEYRESRARNGGSAGRMLRRVQGYAAQGYPVVTYAIIALCVIVWVLELLPGIGNLVYAYGAYWPPYTPIHPWTVLTSAFLHSTTSLLHLPLNMLTLFLVGPALESMLGRARYLAVYLTCALGGSLAVMLLSPTSVVVGASGAIFGLFGAYIVIVHRLGGNIGQMVAIVVINFAIGFFGAGISWQGHLGGLITGAIAGLVVMLTRSRQRRVAQIVGLAALAVLIIVGTAVAYPIVFARLA